MPGPSWWDSLAPEWPPSCTPAAARLHRVRRRRRARLALSLAGFVLLGFLLGALLAAVVVGCGR